MPTARGERSRTIAVSGYYGLGNLGDEAILAGIAAGFCKADPAIRLIAFSANPVATQALHGIEAVHRYSLPALRAALRRSDLLLSGGGGLLQDTTSLRSLLYYLGVLRLAQRLRVPAMVFAQGIGPLRSPIARWATRRALDRVALITVRDQASADLLRELGVTRPPVHVTGDASLLLDPTLEAWQGRAGWPRVVVCVRRWGNASAPWAANLGRALAVIFESRCAEFQFVAMQCPTDVGISSQVAQGVGTSYLMVTSPATPQQAMASLGDADVVVAMRLHALILACMVGVPCVGLAYDPKVRAFMEAVGQPCLPLDAEPSAIAAAIASALDQREQRAARIAAAMEPLRRVAARNVELAASLLAPR